MPTYDYECSACGHTFELFQGINENPKRKCPECKKQKLRRLFGTGAAVMFKGSGFYQTDYRSESYKKAAAADKPPSDSGSSSDSSSASGSSSKSEGASTAKSESTSKKSKAD
jgi:putative FmdB family regulatory protein